MISTERVRTEYIALLNLILKLTAHMALSQLGPRLLLDAFARSATHLESTYNVRGPRD